MSMIEQVTAYKTSDDGVFLEKDAAEKHQALIDFKRWYEMNKCYGNSEGSYVNCEDILDWLTDNKGVVLHLLK